MATAADSQGVEIRADAIYDLPALKKMGWGTTALRSARRKHGLIVRRQGRKSWVLGSDLIAVIKSTGTVVA